MAEKPRIKIVVEGGMASPADKWTDVLRAISPVDKWTDMLRKMVEPLAVGVALVPPIFRDRHDEYLAMCEVLGIDPFEPHPVYDDWSAADVEEAAAVAQLAKGLLQKISQGEATPEEIKSFRQRRLRPGRKARTDAEYAEYAIDLVEQWRKWQKGGFSQQEFADSKGWESRTPLTDAIRWYRDQFGNDSI
jgi:hypothetical protein